MASFASSDTTSGARKHAWTKNLKQVNANNPRWTRYTVGGWLGGWPGGWPGGWVVGWIDEK